MTIRELNVVELSTLIKVYNIQSMFALPFFAKALARQRSLCYVFIQTEHNSFIVPLILDSVFLKGYRLYNRALSFSPPQPFNRKAFSPVDMRECLGKLTKYVREVYACQELDIIQYPHDNQLLSGLSLSKGWCILDEGHDAFLTITADLSKIYFNMEKRHRYTLRKITRLDDANVIELSSETLLRMGYTLEIGCSERSIRDFYNLWLITFEKMRNQLGAERIAAVAESFRFETYYQSIVNLSSKGVCNIFVIYKERIPVCGAVIYLSNKFLSIKQGYWSAGAATIGAKKLGVPVLLQWMIIKWLKNNGYTQYFLGGIDLNYPVSGPTLFKKGFKGKIIKGKRVVYRNLILRQMYPFVRNLYLNLPQREKLMKIIRR